MFLKSGRALVAGAAFIAAFATGGVAQAQTGSEYFSCRASAAYVKAAGQVTVEPLAANATSAFCANDNPGPANIDLTVGPLRVQANGLAKTTIAPQFGITRDQVASADGSAETIRASVGTLVVETDRAMANASASCVNGSPVLTSSGSVGNITLKVGGVAIVTPPLVNGVIEVVGNVVNGLPLNSVLRIETNEVVRTGDASQGDESLTRRALHLTLLENSVLKADVVLAEAKTGRTGSVCAAPSSGGGDNICPEPSTFDQARGICVLVLAGQGPGGTDRVVLLGAPGDLPRGAQVTPIDMFIASGPGRSYSNSPCAGGTAFGTQVAFFGSGGRDRISGSRLNDRIFGLGGKDRLSGALSGDCIEGGPGKDRIDGGDGRDTMVGGSGKDTIDGSRDHDRLVGGAGGDRLYGGSGRDRISGGARRDTMEGAAGADRLKGGAGKDYLSGGPGGDRLAGGAGNDAINTGSPGKRVDRVFAGPGKDQVIAVGTKAKARINCGAGFDTVRIVPAERRFLKGCERVLVVRRAR